MNFSDEVLMAYADGELDEAARQQVQDAINQDPDIARRVATHLGLRESLRVCFEPILEEPVPDRLIAAARAKPRDSSQPNVVPLRGARAPVRPWPTRAALAASFALGALALQLGTSLRQSQSITERDGQLLASGHLDQALSNQVSGSAESQTPVQIGVSFLSKSGRYCRTFQLRDSTSIGGLACKDADNWKLEILARADGSPSSNPEYRPAASNVPPAVIQAVNDTIAGEPLDAKAEAAARAQQWLHTH
jgi:hypothetical protein